MFMYSVIEQSLDRYADHAPGHDTVNDKTQAGYQLYSAQMTSRVFQIRALQKDERMTIKEIGGYLTN